MFFESRRPKGLEVPACKRCNNGSSLQDQVAALFAVTQAPAVFDHGKPQSSEFKHFTKLVSACSQNIGSGPIMIEGKDRLVRTDQGFIHQFKEVKITPHAFAEFLFPWSAKQAMAVWYEKTGEILSSDGSVTIIWLNREAVTSSKGVSEFLQSIPEFSGLRQGEFNVDEQFWYRFGKSEDGSLGIFWPVYHQSFTFLAIIDKNSKRSEEWNTSNFRTSCLLTTSADKGIEVKKISSFLPAD